MERLGVVVPAFRPDAERLSSYLRQLDSTLDPAVIRVELDDATGETRRALAALDLPAVETNAVEKRRGKGAAVTAGFEALSTDILAFVDADGSTPAAELSTVTDALDAADLAAGSRRHPDATVEGHQTFVRRSLGDGFAWLARRALEPQLYDYQCGCKALTDEAWDRVRSHLREPGFAWDLELLAVAGALGLEVREVPIAWEDHPGSTVSPVTTTLSMLRALASTRRRAERLRSGRRERPERDEPIALVDRNRGR